MLSVLSVLSYVPNPARENTKPNTFPYVMFALRNYRSWLRHKRLIPHRLVHHAGFKRTVDPRLRIRGVCNSDEITLSKNYPAF